MSHLARVVTEERCSMSEDVYLNVRVWRRARKLGGRFSGRGLFC